MLKSLILNMRRQALPVLLSLVGIACGMGSSFTAFGMTPGMAQIVGVGAAVFVVFALVIFCWPVKDELVDWRWECQLLTRVLDEIRDPIICRRHVTTRVQGRLLGCATAVESLAIFNWLEKSFQAIILELHVEKENTIEELSEHARILDSLYNAIQALVSLPFMGDLATIEAGSGWPMLRDEAKVIRPFTKSLSELRYACHVRSCEPS